MLDPPDGFAPLFRTSPFLDVLGPFYHRRDGRALILGVRIAEKHCNARGTAHGGLLMTLADIALGYSLAYAEDPPASLTTANLSVDFAGSAKLGDWLEAAAPRPRDSRPGTRAPAPDRAAGRPRPPCRPA